jgi:hypothetical protein
MEVNHKRTIRRGMGPSKPHLETLLLFNYLLQIEILLLAYQIKMSISKMSLPLPVDGACSS